MRIVDIPGFEGRYAIREDGIVISYFCRKGRRSKPYNLKPQWNARYFEVQLHVNHKITHRLIHRLLAEAFIPNPENKPQINHKDGNRRNNALDNLEWCTQSENNKHAHVTGLNIPPRGEKKRNAKLTAEKVREIRALKGRLSQAEIGLRFGIAQQYVTKIQRGERWGWLA